MTSNVVQLSPAGPPAPSDPELLLQAINLVLSLTKHVADQSDRIAALEARLPPPPFADSASLGRRQASGVLVRVFETINLSIFP